MDYHIPVNRGLINTLAILLALIFTLSTQVALSDEDAHPHEIIAYINIYNSAGKTDYGFYRFNTETFERNLINIPGGHGLLSVRVCADGSFALGRKFNHKDFTNELLLMDFTNAKTIQLTRTPNGDERNGKFPSGTFNEYGFSPDGRFAVATFPNGVEIESGNGNPPMVLRDMSSDNATVVFIDLRKWVETPDETSITCIAGCDFPSFSPSGRRFFVPVHSTESSGMKIMVYEISSDNDDDETSPFFGYELPFCEIHQASFASDNLLYILNGDDLILYDLVGSRINRLDSFINLPMRGMGLIPEHLPVNDDFSEGPVSFGLKRFAVVSSVLDNLKIKITLENSTGLNADESNLRSENLIVAYGDIESTSLRWINVPDLPDEAYSERPLYHQLYFPDGFEDIAILASNTMGYQAFRIIDFTSDFVSKPIKGFFMGISDDGKGIMYFQCGDDNCCRYKGTNLSWETIIVQGKKVGVKSNRLYYLDMETGESRVLVGEPSHASEAFFIR